MLKGSCQCGRCRYTLALDALDDVANCHCSICRRTTGATLVTWATVPRASFSWNDTAPAEYKSSGHGVRYFCPGCGAQLAIWTSLSPDTIDITTATLEHPERHPPTRNIWLTTHLPWLPLGDLPGEDEEHY